MRQITNVAINGNTELTNVTVTYADGAQEQFGCSGKAAGVIANLATTLKESHSTKAKTADRWWRRSKTKDSEMLSRVSPTTTAPTVMDAEFMRLVRVVAPKYSEAFPDTDPRLVALDVLRLAPVEAFSAVHPTPLTEISLDQAIDVLEQVGDYMKANNIEPKKYGADVTRTMNADNAKFWGKTK